jgi:hypothetical protein
VGSNASLYSDKVINSCKSASSGNGSIGPHDSIFNDGHDVVRALLLHALWLRRILEGLEARSTLVSRMVLYILTLQRRFVTANHTTF